MVIAVTSEVSGDLKGQPVPLWKSVAGQIAEGVAEIRVKPEDALAQGIDLRTPECLELPPIVRVARVFGDVAVELLIGSDGKALAARALAGPPFLQPTSVDIAGR